MKTVTREWIEANKTKAGGWRNAQLVQLGESWPPRHGWIERAVGKQISDEAYAAFEFLAGKTLSRSERRDMRKKHGRHVRQPD